MTTEHEASRTLVKSPPELWAECSDPGSLARHLGEFGEIKITRLEPESTVAWEGEHASGTVRIEPSGWGTRVTLTAETVVETPPPPEEALEEGQEGQPSQDVEPLTAEGESPPGGESPTIQEDDDATVEEALEDADPAPVDAIGPTRARWRRITARFRRRKPEPSLVEETPSQAASVTQEPEITPQAEPKAQPPPAVDVAPEPEPEPEPEPVPGSEIDAEAILASALDSLGQAHHRPFSRA